MHCVMPMKFVEFQDPESQVEAQGLSDKLFAETLAKLQVAWAKEEFSEAASLSESLYNLSLMRAGWIR